MFKNIGNKLKVTGKVFFWIGVVISVLLLLCGLIMAAISEAGLITILIASIIYMCIFLVSAWTYYGIGCTVKNTEENKSLLEQNKELLKQNNELLNKLYKFEEDKNNNIE